MPLLRHMHSQCECHAPAARPRAATPEAQSASKHIDAKHMTEGKAKAAPVPAGAPRAVVKSCTALKKEEAELIKKLRGAQDRYLCSDRPKGLQPWDSHTLEQGEREEYKCKSIGQDGQGASNPRGLQR